MSSKTLEVRTRGRGLYDITREIQSFVRASGIKQGLCNVFVHHTSASLIINENADPTVQRDLEAFLERLVPDGDAIYHHTAEGPDDMPAHVRTALTQVSLGIPVLSGRCALGTWQGVYLWEHRHYGHLRRVTLTALGE